MKTKKEKLNSKLKKSINYFYSFRSELTFRELEKELKSKD